MVTQYRLPEHWLKYDRAAVLAELTEAKAAVLSLSSMPFQRSWAETLQEMELKREVAGTSKIEGAAFTDREFEDALSSQVPDDRLNRSQLQARAARNTYRWIAKLPKERPVSSELIREIHIRIVTGCDDDHCAPGMLRGSGENVIFGRPRHRGAEGGAECRQAFERLCEALNTTYRAHDGLVQAIAAHYHLGAIHPFQDGNGRTARALEALLLQRADLRDTLFIAMSNYYYDEKETYLRLLGDAAGRAHDLTEFLRFGLRGIASQSHRLLREIRRHVSRSLYRDVMARMYERLRSTRKRALAERQLGILERLLDADHGIPSDILFRSMSAEYKSLKAAGKAFARDIDQLVHIGAIDMTAADPEPGATAVGHFVVSARLEWPTEITDTKFFEEIGKLPRAKTRFRAG